MAQGGHISGMSFMGVAGRVKASSQNCLGFAIAMFEAERDRWFLWTPVLISIGIAGYFVLPQEPSLIFVIATSLAMAGMSRALRYGPYLGPMAAILLVVAGFALAFGRSMTAAAPVLSEKSESYSVEGWIEQTEIRGQKRRRHLIRVLHMENLAAVSTPYRVRVTSATSDPPLAVGDVVSMRAVLYAPPGPVAPGAYDFARSAWFDRIGGVGYAISRPSVLLGDGATPLDIRFKAAIDRLRTAVAARISQALEGEAAGFARALIIGERSALPRATVQALRDAGLGHLLAISGLHMALMAGTLFWALRALLAIPSGLALHYPIKKWAAGFALVSATGYLALSGAAVSTQRAFIMISIMFAAILIDRPAISMRNLALAALVVLLMGAENLLSVSFQMSFMTVAALIAAYESRGHGAERGRMFEFGSGLPARAVRIFLLYVVGIMATTMIASLTTGPIAAYHFNRISIYGLAGNLLAIPLTGLLVMPMAGLSLLAMPFGLEATPLAAMGYGLGLILKVAHAVAETQGAVRGIAQPPLWTVTAFVAGVLWLCLWRKPWRFLGLIAAAIGILAPLLPAGAEKPVILVSRGGKLVAMRNQEGHLAFMDARRDNYSARAWLARDGDPASVSSARARKGLACGALGCSGALPGGKRLAIISHPAALAEDCADADILIALMPLDRACRGPELVMDKRMIDSGGAQVIYLRGSKYVAVNANEIRGRRPWATAPRRYSPGN